MNNTTQESESDDKRETYDSIPNEKEDAKNDDQNGSELAKLKKELKKCNESKDAFEKEYFKCEKELRIKTEETEKLKLEIRDLRKYWFVWGETDPRTSIMHKACPIHNSRPEFSPFPLFIFRSKGDKFIGLGQDFRFNRLLNP